MTPVRFPRDAKHGAPPEPDAADGGSDGNEGDRAALLEALLALSQSAILVMSPDRKPLYANARMCELSGYTLDELLALPTTAALTPPEDDARAVSSIRAAVESGRVGRVGAFVS